MNQDERYRILQQHQVWLKTNREEGVRADFTNADLVGANMSCVIFKNTNLGYTDLVGINLENTGPLLGTNIQGAKGIFSFGPIGRERLIGCAVKHSHVIMIKLGSFWGSSDEAIEKITKEYGDSSLYEEQIKMGCRILGEGEEECL